MLQLLLMKCLPILVYGLEVCALDNRSSRSLDFTTNRFFVKLFKTSESLKIVTFSLNQSACCIAPCMVQTTLKRSGMDHKV